MLNRCQNCGGALLFDIASGKVKCESCDSLFEPDENKDNTSVSENPANAKYNMNVFTCPNCGGEIASNELEAVEYCLYCGSFVTLTSHVQKIRKPDRILPFAKTKEECKKSFTKLMRRNLYAPKDFRDDKFLEGFKGIYIPYWNYDYSFGPDVKLHGSTETRHGNYIHKQHLEIECNVDGKVDGLCYDASSTLDDSISCNIAPFDSQSFKPFNESYMYGFFADTADIKTSLYRKEADEIARDKIWDKVSSDKELKKSNPDKPGSDKSFDEQFNIEEKSFLSMIPIWFLTWRKDDRVAYSVMNGNNGKIYSEVPIDTKRYLLFSLLLAVPLFFFLNWLTTFTASCMLKFSLLLSVMMVLFYSRQLDKIVRRLLHADDLGYLDKHKEAKENADKAGSNWIGELFRFVKGLLKKTTFWGIVCGIVVFVSSASFILIGAAVFLVVIVVYTIYRLIKDIIILKDTSILIDLAGSFLSMILSIIMLRLDPAGDELYYVVALVCIAGVGLSAVFAMKRYNELVTRPLPHFFERQAGGEE